MSTATEPSSPSFPADATATRFEGSLLPGRTAVAEPWPVGARLGSIRVIRILAVGGMGEVFEGFDESLRRRVALKALRRDRLSTQARARLLLEARVLSQLSDPRICGIHGWIEDPGGEFLVLELIEGETLEGYFEKGHSRAAGLRIAADLAEVLAASHRKGVIHRDLKPSNLMLTRGGQLKVLDFGISSVVALPETGSGSQASLDLGPEDEALRSRAGSIVGTIHYMSPEQARGEKVTAASDMYSFGLLLEELLTGRKPHEDAAGVLAILARLQKGERPPPSGPLPPPLAELILGLTAAAPEARPTAAEAVVRLAAIRDAPRRRWRRAAAAGIALAALAAGLWHTHRLTVERNLARAAERRALASHREAEEMVVFLESLFAGADPTQADGQDLTVREVLDRGAERIRESLADQPAARARLLATIGRAYTELFLLEQADAVLAEALALSEAVHGPGSPEAGDALADLAILRREQDRNPEARELQVRALEIARRAGGQPAAKTARRLLELGNTEARLAHFESAEASIREAVAIREKSPEDRAGLSNATLALANLLRNRGRYGEALELYRRALELEEPRQPLHVRGNTRYNAGITLSQLGRFDEAEATLEETLAMWTKVYGAGHGNVAKVELALATVDRKKERWAAAERRYRTVLEIWSRSHGPQSTNVAFGLNNLGNLYLEQGDLARAEPAYREALGIFEAKHGKDHPNVAMSLANLARCLGGQGRHAEAVAHLRRVVAIGEQSGGAASVDLAWDRLFLAQALWRQPRRTKEAAEEARREASRGITVLEPAVGPGNTDLADLMKETPELFAGLGETTS